MNENILKNWKRKT